MTNRNHIVYRVADMLQAGFDKADRDLQPYNDKVRSLYGDVRLAPEYKRTETKKVLDARAEAVRSENAEMRAAIRGLIAEERTSLKKSITGHMPTAEQTAAIEVLRRIKPTQTEFDAVAEQVKGVYLCEKELADVAADKGLNFAFMPLDYKLKKLDILEQDATNCCNYEGKREDIGKWPDEINLGGIYHGTALQWFCGDFAKPEQYIKDYEAGSTFTERVDALDPFEQINMLYQSNPQDEAAITKLYKGHKAYVDGNDRTDMARDAYEADLIALLPSLVDNGGEPVNFE